MRPAGRALPAQPSPAQRPRPRRRNQEAVTWGAADWLPAARIAAASKLRRRATSSQAQCLLRRAAFGLPGVRLFPVAPRWFPVPCGFGRPQPGKGGRTRRGCCGTPGFCAADARRQLPAAQTVVLRSVPVLAHPVEPAVGLLPPSPATWKSLRLEGCAVGEREERPVWSSEEVGADSSGVPGCAVIALGNFALCLPWGNWKAVRQALSPARIAYWRPWSSRRRPSPSCPPGPTPSPSPRSCPAAVPRRRRPQKTPSNPWVSRAPDCPRWAEAESRASSVPWPCEAPEGGLFLPPARPGRCGPSGHRPHVGDGDCLL